MTVSKATQILSLNEMLSTVTGLVCHVGTSAPANHPSFTLECHYG